MSELTKISTEWRNKANKLLTESGLVETLSTFGEVYFTGAYSHNLMMHGDVDISVVRDHEFSIEEVFEILKELYLQGKFRSYFIGGDWDDPRKGNEFPRGYYLGLKEKLNGEKWKFDIWFLSKMEFENRNDNQNLKTASEEQKELILSCKQYRNDHKISITSKEIYNKVLQREWLSIEDLKISLNV